MAPHSSTLAWKIPWMEEPGGLQSMGSLRVGHDWATSLSLFTFMHWRRKWQPTPVFLPGESQGRRSLVGCPLWRCTESDTTEWLNWTELKQFLQSFSIKHITGIPYNTQALDIVKRTHHTLKLQIKKFKKGEYTGTFLSSLPRADYTRFQCNIFFNPITIVNTALF